MTTTTATATSTASTAPAAGPTGSQQLAGNFDTFLQLLTTQLQNQDPLDPLDTSQFTEQLVEFASVQQELDMNTNLQTLISMQQSTETTAALQLLGDTVTINSNTASLSNATNSPATWGFNAASPAMGNITITSSTGQVAYTGTTALSAGPQSYTWNGQGNNGVTWPDGNYTLSVSATGANGQPVTVATQVQGVVSAINVSQFPPIVTVNGQTYPMNQIQTIIAGNTITNPVPPNVTANGQTYSLNQIPSLSTIGANIGQNLKNLL